MKNWVHIQIFLTVPQISRPPPLHHNFSWLPNAWMSEARTLGMQWGQGIFSGGHYSLHSLQDLSSPTSDWTWATAVNMPESESESESEAAQSCPTPCDPMDCSPPGSSVHGILQARIREWIAISFSNKRVNLGLYFKTVLKLTVFI